MENAFSWLHNFMVMLGEMLTPIKNVFLTEFDFLGERITIFRLLPVFIGGAFIIWLIAKIATE